jgi:hypothetical protein
MLSSSQKRFGWGVIVIVFLGCLASYWIAGPSATPLKLSEAEKTALATMPEEEYSSWLTTFSDKLKTEDSSKQVLLLQGVPNEPPLVIAAPQDTDGDEEPTHWRAPWPELIAAFCTGKIEQPTQVRSRYQGFDYVHHLIPFEPTHTRCVLINEIVPAPNWLGIRFLTMLLATLGSVALFIAD